MSCREIQVHGMGIQHVTLILSTPPPNSFTCFFLHFIQHSQPQNISIDTPSSSHKLNHHRTYPNTVIQSHNGSHKLRSSHLLHQRSPFPRPKYHNHKRHLNPLRTPLRTQNDTLPLPPSPIRLPNPQSRHPRTTLPALGNPAVLLPRHQSRLLRLAHIPEETTSRLSSSDMFRL